MRLIFVILLLSLPRDALAGQFTLFQASHFNGQSEPLVVTRHASLQSKSGFGTASLFADTRTHGLFAPLHRKQIARSPKQQFLNPNSLRAVKIRHLIGQAEAGAKGYDAIQHSVKKRPSKRPTDMTLQEIFTWITFTPNQNHAIGRYQFIPATLRRLTSNMNLPSTVLFSPELQDRLADELLHEAGLNALNNGEIERHLFMNNLAKIWAGLPTPSGLSYYEGYAGNKATMTWQYFDVEMARIFAK